MSFASKVSPDTAKIGGIGRLEIQVAKEDVTVQWFKSKICCKQSTVEIEKVFI